MGLGGQRALLIWAIAGVSIFGSCIFFLFDMIPMVPATLTAEEIARFYAERAGQMRFGATLSSWSSSFMLPFSLVNYFQMRKFSHPDSPWPLTQLFGGALMTVFLVLPPILWGTIAMDPDRPAAITASLHYFAITSYVTTTQYYVFQMVAIGVCCLTVTQGPGCPYPRWMGFATLFVAFALEAGAFAFMTKTGPFAWNGLFAFWIPLVLFGLWYYSLAILLLKEINRQEREFAA